MVRNYKHLAGPDATIDISLLEYGLAWFDDPDKDEIEFFYGVKTEGENYVAFDNGGFKRDLDPRSEWNWVKDWNDIASSCGVTAEEFLAMPLTEIVHSMLSYYGYQNVFGETYWGAWFWNKNLQRFQLEHPVDVRAEVNRKRACNAKKNWIRV